MAPLLSRPPRFGVSAVILGADGKLLVGQRFGSHGAGSWQLPGGHVEDGEGLLVAAARETKEETNLDVEARGVIATTYDVFERESKHYVTFFVLCTRTDPGAEAEAMEHHKCPEWLWKSVDELLPLDLFLPLSHLLQRSLDLAAVTQSAGLVFRLPSDATVSLRWDAACVGARQLAGDLLAVPPGRDVAIVDASPDNVDCRLAVVVAIDEPEPRQETVEWPLGGDLVLLPFKDGAGVEHPSESVLELLRHGRRARRDGGRGGTVP